MTQDRDETPLPTTDPQPVVGASGHGAELAYTPVTSREREAEDLVLPARALDRGHPWWLFRTVVGVVGLAVAGHGIWLLLSGLEALPRNAAESVQAGPSAQSSFGTLAAVYAGTGLGFLLVAVRHRWRAVLGLLCTVVFLGGVGRIVAWALFGTPHWSMILLMVLELVVPPVLLVWYGWINKSLAMREGLREQAAR